MSDLIHNVQSWSPWDEIRAPLPTKPPIEQYPLHDDDETLHKAAYRGEITESLIESTRDINTRSYYGCIPLHLAIRADHPKAVYLLLAAGADASLKDDLESAYQLSFDALNLASHVGAHRSLAVLIDYGVAVPANALYLSASRNRVECLRVLIEKLGPEGFSDASKEEGVKAALERAALCWHAESVEFLLGCAQTDPQQLGIALNNALSHYDCDDRCRSPAIFGPPPDNLLKVLGDLIAAGADVNVQYSFIRNNKTYTCSIAFWACLHTSTVPREVVQFLIDHDLRVKDPAEDLSLLFGIIGDTNNEPSLVKAFIEAGANVSGTDSDLNTPLHLAAHNSFAKLLLEHGADVCAKNLQGKTPLHTACDQGLLGVAELLIAHGAGIHDTTTDQRWTPLMFASGEHHLTEMGESWGSREELVKLLLGKDANACVAAVDGLTPLHRAARSGKTCIVEQLIASGADVQATTTNGETALHAACSVRYLSGHAQASTIVKLLVNLGADVDAKDINGATPLFIALSLEDPWLNTDIVNFLIERDADVRTEDKHGKRAIDQIDSTIWEFNGSGLLQRKVLPQSNHAMVTGDFEPW